MTLYYSLVSCCIPEILSLSNICYRHTRQWRCFVVVTLRLRVHSATPQPHRNVDHVLTIFLLLGLPPVGDRDAHLLCSHRAAAVHMAPQALHLHLGEPYSCQTTVWHEGMSH
jgi:hypothetical protein